MPNTEFNQGAMSNELQRNGQILGDIHKTLVRQSEYFQGGMFKSDMMKIIDGRHTCAKDIAEKIKDVNAVAEETKKKTGSIPMQLYFFLGTSLAIIGTLVTIIMRFVMKQP